MRNKQRKKETYIQAKQTIEEGSTINCVYDGPPLSVAFVWWCYGVHQLVGRI
jgi:hypothetical protein